MSSVPNSYIDDLRSIVLATLNRIEQLRMRVVFGLEMLKGAFGQELVFDSDGNIVVKSFKFENLASAPAGTEKGLSYYNTATNELYVYINSGWVSVGAAGGATDHSLLSNLAWSAAGHTINADVDIGGNDIEGIVSLKSEESSTLNLGHTAGGGSVTTKAAIADDGMYLYDDIWMNNHKIIGVSEVSMGGSNKISKNAGTGDMEFTVASGDAFVFKTV